MPVFRLDSPRVGTIWRYSSVDGLGIQHKTRLIVSPRTVELLRGAHLTKVRKKRPATPLRDVAGP